MDNRPVRLQPIVAFRESPLNIKIRYPEEYTIPTPITVEFRMNRRRIEAEVNSATIDGQIVTVPIPVETVRNLPNKIDIYIKTAGGYTFGGELHILMGAGTPVPGIFEINTFFGIAVYITDLELVKIEVLKAQTASAAAIDAYQDILQKLENLDETLPPGPPGPAGESGEDGAPGREIELQASGSVIQFKYTGDVSWTNLFDVASLSVITTLQTDLINLTTQVETIQETLDNLPEQ